ncbi:MAG: HTH domain-containing protein, partial [Halohasta sp.]
ISKIKKEASKILKIERLMNLILLLTNNPGIKAKKIAEFFDISERTVYRDLNTLSSAHFPLSSATDKGGGYFIKK